MLVNTQEFRKEAAYFQKFGKYDCGEKGTGTYERYWYEQKKRCLYGYSVGGMWIPGLYYSYLNFNPIEIVVRRGTGKSGDRIVDFPKFWDVDYTFFMSVHIAKNGICDVNGYPIESHEERVKEYKKLPIDIGLKLDEENLRGGHHLFWDKCRGVGASWKASGIASRQFHHVEKSKTFMFADDDEYLKGDGLFSKFIFLRSFLNKHTGFNVGSIKSDMNEMHYISGYYPPSSNRTPHGLQSEVMGQSLAGDPDKARGKRGSFILWEEFGNTRRVKKAWDITEHSLIEADVQYGMNVAFGTGGTVGEGSDHMEDFALNPRAYNLLTFENRFDKDLEGMDCTLFTPASCNVQFVDEHGNSDLVKGTKLVQEKYEKAHSAKDSKKILRVKAELPLNILNSLMSTGNNKFQVPGLEKWKNKVKTDPVFKKIGVNKVLDRDVNGKIVSELAPPEIIPVNNYPHRKDHDIRGCVVEYATPYTDASGNVPDNLYIICCDPYAEDDAEDLTSLGAAYVIMNYNNIVPGDMGDRIVASWVGRRKTTLEFSDILFLLSERWNAKICIEADRGTVVGDAQLRRKTHLLEPQLSLSYDESLTIKRQSNVKYGMKISSGKFNHKMLIGDQYIIDWLQREREINEVSSQYNYNLLYDVGLMEELTKYRQGEGNYDRISALRVGMFYMRDMIYNNKVAKKSNPHKEGKFTRFRQKHRV